jgi:NhaA family Na+:H+ antiporter
MHGPMTDDDPNPFDNVAEHPPGASPGARRVSRAVMRSLERFIRVQSASGILLLMAAAVALAWANTRWDAAYEALWERQLELAIGGWSVRMSLHSFVNDVLMAIFFFVIGLEVRREIHGGELSNFRRASLPVIAAVGGMAVPAGIYLLFGPADAQAGWSVPVSTDTAFALGVLALLGSRIVPSLRVLLLTIAIVDDLVAIVIIAIFYSTGIELRGVVLTLTGLGAILGLQWFGVRRVAAYVAPALVVWTGCWWAGIHPTIAGILVGLLTPARTWYGHKGFLDAAYRHLGTIARGLKIPDRRSRDIRHPMSELRRVQREAVSPVERIEAALHPWAAFVIMPVFVFANAGINFASADLAAAPRLIVGVVAGLVLGKLAGIVLASRIAVKLGIAELPPQVSWHGMVIVGAVAGIGFTMALFIADLAFTGRPVLQDVSTVAVLIASAASALLALILGRILLPPAGALARPTDDLEEREA